jgi:hypothetical protein
MRMISISDSILIILWQVITFNKSSRLDIDSLSSFTGAYLFNSTPSKPSLTVTNKHFWSCSNFSTLVEVTQNRCTPILCRCRATRKIVNSRLLAFLTWAKIPRAAAITTALLRKMVIDISWVSWSRCWMNWRKKNQWMSISLTICEW